MKHILISLLTLPALAACAAHATMEAGVLEKNKQVIRRLYEDAINGGQVGLLDELVADDYTGPNSERGAAGFRNTVEGLRTGFPDIRFTLEDLIAEGDRVSVRWRWTGTHSGQFRQFPITGKVINDTGMAIYQLRDGKVFRSWVQTDRLGVLQQMGVVP